MTTETLSYDDLEVSTGAVYDEMGYHGAKPDATVSAEVDALIASIREWLRPCYAFSVMRGRIDTERKMLWLTPNGGQETEFASGRIVTRQLRGAEAYAVFVCTAGHEYQSFLNRLTAQGDMVKLYAANAIGSVLAERTADYMERVLQEQIDKLGWNRTNRFSPGYCGWHVREQQKLFPLLNGETAGVRLTESSLMMPIKSVSGVIGLGPKVRYLEYSCGLCDYKDCYKRRAK